MSLRLKVTFRKVRSVFFYRRALTRDLSQQDGTRADAEKGKPLLTTGNELSAEDDGKDFREKDKTAPGDKNAAISNETY